MNSDDQLIALETLNRVCDLSNSLTADGDYNNDENYESVLSIYKNNISKITNKKELSALYEESVKFIDTSTINGIKAFGEMAVITIKKMCYYKKCSYDECPITNDDMANSTVDKTFDYEIVHHSSLRKSALIFKKNDIVKVLDDVNVCEIEYHKTCFDKYIASHTQRELAVCKECKFRYYTNLKYQFIDFTQQEIVFFLTVIASVFMPIGFSYGDAAFIPNSTIADPLTSVAAWPFSVIYAMMYITVLYHIHMTRYYSHDLNEYMIYWGLNILQFIPCLIGVILYSAIYETFVYNVYSTFYPRVIIVMLIIFVVFIGAVVKYRRFLKNKNNTINTV